MVWELWRAVACLCALRGVDALHRCVLSHASALGAGVLQSRVYTTRQDDDRHTLYDRLRIGGNAQCQLFF